jgi:hypothetical protein
MKLLKSSLFVFCALVCTYSRAQTCTNVSYGSLTAGTITAPAQVNEYCFTGNAGDLIDFTISTSSGLSPKLQLYTSTGTLVGTNNLAFCSGTAMQWWGVKLPSAGTYKLLVSDCAATGTGTYDVYLQRTNVPAGTTPVLGGVTSGKISTATQSNTYTFSLNAGDEVTLSIVSSGLSPEMVLYNPDGTQFGESNLAFCSGTAMDWIPNTPVSKAGTYTLLVNACGAQAVGSYSFYLQRTNNPFAPVSSLLWGQDQSGSITAVPQSQVYSFPGTANDVMNLTVAATGFSPKLVIYSPNGTLFGQNNLAFCSGSTLQWNNIKITATGTYRVFVKDCSDTLIGKYNLSSQCFGECARPKPTVSTILPTSAVEGSGAVVLTVNGTNFFSDSVVEFNSKQLVTTFVNSGQLKATIPVADLTTPGSYPVEVFTPTPGGGYSNPVTFIVTGPVITSLSPPSTIARAAGFTLIVNGAGFVTTSFVYWNATALTTTYVSATQLKATVPAAEITTAGVFPITVHNGTVTSPRANFTVDNPPPGITSLSPSSIIVGGTAFSLVVNGSGFVPGSLVEWNGQGLATAYVSSSELRATVPASDVVSGTAKITASSVAPGGGATGALLLTINNPVAVVSSISPVSATHGAAAFTLTVNGYDFNEGAQVLWNGVGLTTALVNDTQLHATVPAADITTAGKPTVTVKNPAPTPKASAAVTFTINGNDQ